MSPTLVYNMKWNDHQIRLWRKMISTIEDFLDGKTDAFTTTVGELEAALDASEISDKALIKVWYSYWGPLEITRAICGHNVSLEDVRDDLQKMKKFLLEIHFSHDHG